jgi:transposase
MPGSPNAGPTSIGAQDAGRTIVWVDESGLYLLPARVRTFAPKGQTPRLTVPLTHDHLSVTSGLTPTGRLFLQVRSRAFKGPDMVRFLRHLLRHLSGKLLVISDGSPIHRCQAVKDYLAEGGARRLLLEPLPGYAPDTNPDQGVWRYLKWVELRNRCCHDRPELTAEFRRATARLRHTPHILKVCTHHAGYQV